MNNLITDSWLYSALMESVAALSDTLASHEKYQRDQQTRHVEETRILEQQVQEKERKFEDERVRRDEKLALFVKEELDKRDERGKGRQERVLTETRQQLELNNNQVIADLTKDFVQLRDNYNSLSERQESTQRDALSTEAAISDQKAQKVWDDDAIRRMVQETLNKDEVKEELVQACVQHPKQVMQHQKLIEAVNTLQQTVESWEEEKSASEQRRLLQLQLEEEEERQKKVVEGQGEGIGKGKEALFPIDEERVQRIVVELLRGRRSGAEEEDSVRGAITSLCFSAPEFTLLKKDVEAVLQTTEGVYRVIADTALGERDKWKDEVAEMKERVRQDLEKLHAQREEKTLKDIEVAKKEMAREREQLAIHLGGRLDEMKMQVENVEKVLRHVDKWEGEIENVKKEQRVLLSASGNQVSQATVDSVIESTIMKIEILERKVLILEDVVKEKEREERDVGEDKRESISGKEGGEKASVVIRQKNLEKERLDRLESRYFVQPRHDIHSDSRKIFSLLTFFVYLYPRHLYVCPVFEMRPRHSRMDSARFIAGYRIWNQLMPPRWARHQGIDPHILLHPHPRPHLHDLLRTALIIPPP